jgi:hypothetical protein
MVAGHETTANTLSWALFELSRHLDIQDKLRTEIREKITEKGNNIFGEHDFESMPYLTAVVKVSRTFNLISFHVLFACGLGGSHSPHSPCRKRSVSGL